MRWTSVRASENVSVTHVEAEPKYIHGKGYNTRTVPVSILNISMEIDNAVISSSKGSHDAREVAGNKGDKSTPKTFDEQPRYHRMHTVTAHARV